MLWIGKLAPTCISLVYDWVKLRRSEHYWLSGSLMNGLQQVYVQHLSGGQECCKVLVYSKCGETKHTLPPMCNIYHDEERQLTSHFMTPSYVWCIHIKTLFYVQPFIQSLVEASWQERLQTFLYHGSIFNCSQSCQQPTQESITSKPILPISLRQMAKLRGLRLQLLQAQGSWYVGISWQNRAEMWYTHLLIPLNTCSTIKINSLLWCCICCHCLFILMFIISEWIQNGWI